MSESPRPTKESMRELVMAYGEAQYLRGGHRQYLEAAHGAEAALLSAIDTILDEREKRTADASGVEKMVERNNLPRPS